jgi:hypothetical protein
MTYELKPGDRIRMIDGMMHVRKPTRWERAMDRWYATRLGRFINGIMAGLFG